MKNFGNGVYFGEADAKRFSERPASVPQKDSRMAVLLRRFLLTFLKQLFFKKVSVHTEISLNVSEYKKVSEYNNFTEYENVSEYKKSI